MSPVQLLVTAAIIQYKGKYLITQRLLNKPEAGRREFPGGKVEFGEDPRRCLERELLEELGICIQAHEPFEYSSHVYGEHKHVVLLGFQCTYISGEIQKKEIADFKRVNPIEMQAYDITQADLPFVNKILATHTA